MAKFVTFSESAGNYTASINGGAKFKVGRRVTYQGRPDPTVGLLGGDPSGGQYKSEDYAAQLGFWADFIAPTAICESSGNFNTVNSYDRAFFTFGFLQFAAHVANGDFVKYFRKVLAETNFQDYFPDLVLEGGRICRVETTGTLPLESDASTTALMTYLNPTVQAVEDIEVINSAKLIDWTKTGARGQAIQVETGFEILRSSLKAYVQRYSLDGRSDLVCLVVMDIRHQGRASSQEILRAVSTPDDEQAYKNLLQIGTSLYANRAATLKREIEKRRASGALGNRKYNLAAGDFV